MKTLVLGLGNPILGDDGVGWRIVEELRGQNPATWNDNRTPHFSEEAVEFDCAALSGLSLMERLIGYERVLLVDAVLIPGHATGEVIFDNLNNIPHFLTSRLASAHDTSLDTALAIGRQLGAELPSEISVLGVSTTACFDFSESLSSEVSKAVPDAVQKALNWLSQSTTGMEVTIPGYSPKKGKA